ncbi:MAG: hypothetical protein RL685_3330 [Pseudomonadota bacterium]|jgi:transcriptional regulator with XRE-family HTH domain
MGIPLKTVAKQWLRDPSLQAVYDALAEEFALAKLIIGARTRAELTQEELAKRMGAALSDIVRLESGKAAPSLSTLRRIAKATGTKLEISFAPRYAARKTKAA